MFKEVISVICFASENQWQVQKESPRKWDLISENCVTSLGKKHIVADSLLQAAIQLLAVSFPLSFHFHWGKKTPTDCNMQAIT